MKSAFLNQCLARNRHTSKIQATPWHMGGRQWQWQWQWHWQWQHPLVRGNTRTLKTHGWDGRAGGWRWAQCWHGMTAEIWKGPARRPLCCPCRARGARVGKRTWLGLGLPTRLHVTLRWGPDLASSRGPDFTLSDPPFRPPVGPPRPTP